MKKTEKKPKIHRQKTYDLNLTKYELVHIRDMLSVLLPPDGQETLSQSLAQLEGRKIIESMLWNKVVALCGEAGLPIDSEAPDYIVAPISTPAIGVFHINQELAEAAEDDSSGFLPDSEEDDSEEDDDGDD